MNEERFAAEHEERLVIELHGPTTSLLHSKDGTSPAQKERNITVKVAPLAPISPYIIRVTQETPAPRTHRPSAHQVGVNFLAPRLLWRKKFVESDGTLSFTEEDISELHEDETEPAVGADIFSSRRHPFQLRAVVMFSLAALLVVMPMRAFSTRDELNTTKSVITNESRMGIAALKQAATALADQSPEAAVRAFEQAEFSFSRAATLADMNVAVQAIAKLIPEGRMAVSGSHSLAAIQALSSGAVRMSTAFAELSQETTLTSKLVRMEAAIAGLEHEVRDAHTALAQVDTKDLPAELPITTVRQTVAALHTELPTLRHALQLVTSLLGHTAPQRYLVVFQNDHELRPTGGFMGSFALLDVRHGAVTNLEIPGDGTYNLQGRLTKFVAAPKPLAILNPRLEFQDTNWYMDFPRSAQMISEFYAKAGGPSVDGVIAINSGFMEQLLQVTGPVAIPGTNEVVGADTFMETAQRLAQFDYDKELNEPKAFLGQLAPKILQLVSHGDAEQLLALGEVFSSALRNKDVQIWSRQSNTAATLRSFGWDGAQLPADSDYVALVNANIAGGKTDGSIREHVNDRTTLQPDGRVLKTIELTRTHEGVRGDIFTGDTNVTHHRLYVPKGAKLLSLQGSVEPDPGRFGSDPTLPRGPEEAESDAYTVFSAWSRLEPGQSATIRFSYELPDTLDAQLTSLSTVYDMQSGTDRTLTHTVSFPPGWNLIWHDDRFVAQGTTLRMEVPFERSLVGSVLFQR